MGRGAFHFTNLGSSSDPIREPTKPANYPVLGLSLSLQIAVEEE